MQQISGKIEKKVISDPIKARNSDRTYQTVTYTIAGLEFSKYLDSKDSTFNVGENVIANAQLNIKKKDGTTYNSLDKDQPFILKPQTTQTSISQYLGGEKSTQLTTIPVTTSMDKHENPPLPFSPLRSNYDPRGQIKGNSITNGVQLAIARYGEHTTKEHIRNAALEILSIHKDLEDL